MVDTWDWTGKTDNLTLSSPDGLVLDVESLKTIVAEAQAAAEAEKNADAAEGDAAQQPEPADSTDQTTDQQSDQTDNQNTDQIENSDGSADNATDNTDEATDNLTAANVLRELLPETLSGTLDLTLTLDPAIDGVDTGNHTVVLPGDTFTVNLPSGLTLSDEMITNTEKGTFDIFQSDAEGNPTTLKIAEGTIENEGTTLKVTFVEPTETADTENTTAYYVGSPTEGTVPAAQTEGKEQIEKLDASIDLKVAVKAELLTDEASELTWTLQTKADDENVKQEATLALPGMTELADQFGVVVAAPEEPQEQEDEQTDQTDDETTIPPASNDIEPLAIDRVEVTLGEKKGVSLTTKWLDNNDTSNRGTTKDFTGCLSLSFTNRSDDVTYVLKEGSELIVDAGTDGSFTLSKETVNELIYSLTTIASGNTWTSSAQLPESINVQTFNEEGDKATEFNLYIDWSITYTQPSGEANAGDHWYKLTTDKDDPTKQYMQLLKDVSFTFVGKLGNDTFESAFGNENADFTITEVVNNTEQTPAGKLENYFDLSKQPSPQNNQVTISDRLPAYDLNGLPIEYKVTYNGAQEGDDYYQATYNNSGSGNHGSDVSAMWNGGSLTLTRVGNAHFNADKVWQDNDPATRKSVTYTLWRYSMQSLPASGSGGTGIAPVVENPYTTAAQVKLNGEFATVTVGDDALQQDSFDIGSLFAEKYGEETGLPGDKTLNLPKYDPEGYPYIYCVREDTVPSGYEQIFGSYNADSGLYEDRAPQYTNVEGNLTPAISGGWERSDNDMFVYNGGTLCNHLSETIEVKQDKTWKISAFQDQLQNVHVEFTLYQHVIQKDASNPIEAIINFFAGGSADKTWAVARDRDGNEITKTIEGFASETLTQTISGYYPKYGPLGNELEYKWVETGVTQYLGDPNDPDTQQFDTNFKLKDENDPTQGATFQLQLTSAEGTSEPLQFSSTTDEETGTIVNAFANETYERVDKWWELPADDGTGSGEFAQYYPSGVENTDNTVKVSLYRDNELVGTYTMDGEKDAQPQPILADPSGDFADFADATWQETSGYHIDFEKLPQYSETGHKYSYLVIEQQKDGWYATRNYDPEQHLTTIRNFIPEGEGSLLYVSKDWVDGGDSAHRNTSVVQLVAKRDMSNQDGTLSYEKGEIVTEIGDNSDANFSDTGVVDEQGRIYLSESNGWFAEITIGIDNLTAEDFDIVEIGMQSPAANKDGSHTFYPAYSHGEQVYGYDENGNAVSYRDAWAKGSDVSDEIWAHTGWEEGDAPRVATDQHVYEVTYGTTEFNVGGENKPVLTVHNRRIGIINLDASKTWVDTLADEDVNDRPDAELVLTSDASSEDHQVFSIGEGGRVYTQLPNGNKIPLYSDYSHDEGEIEGVGVPLTAAASKEQAADGQAYLEGDTLVMPLDKTKNEQTFEFLDLPKYDGDGEVHSYSIKERWVDNAGEYRSSSKTSDYTVGPLHFNDNQEYDFTNQPVDTVSKVFYKHWKDTYVNEEQNQRPDIYLTLYKVSEATDNKPVPVDGYVHFLWDNAEEVTNEDPDYWQKVTISNLDKYDELGDEIQYYATESMSITNPADLDYTDVSFSDEKTNYDPYGNGNIVAGTEWNKGEADFKVYLGDKTGEDKEEDYANWAIHSGGTFVNQINSDLVANGTKIWQNVPSDFDLKIDMPEITVYLQRRLAPDDGSTNGWTDPTVVKKGEAGYTGAEDTVYWNADTSAAADYGVLKDCGDGTQIVAYTTTFKKDAATNQWTYQLWHTGLNGEIDNPDQPRLPKYDEDGNLYQYRALEAMWGLAGSAAWGEDTDAQIDPTDAVQNVFDVSHGETGSFILTNRYESPEGNLTVRKIFDGRDEGDHYPNVTFTLYRQYATANGALPDAEPVGSPKTISRDEFEKNNGMVDVTFEGLDIYAPNGEYWQYYVVESTIGGYETTVALGAATNVGATNVAWEDGAQSPNAVTTVDGKVTGTLVKNDNNVDITFANTYDTDKIKLNGTKTWADRNNMFGSRPDAIDLWLNATSDSGQKLHANAVKLDVKNAVCESETEPYVVWNETGDNWTYTIYNLERWAPDGSRWKYSVQEKLASGDWDDAGYVTNPASGTVFVQAPETGDGTLPKLTNSLKGRATVKKTWSDGDNQYQQRPTEVSVTLQAKLSPVDGSDAVSGDLSGWRNASDIFEQAVSAGVDIPADLDNQKLNGPNSWTKTWSDLPLQVKIDNAFYDVEYRVVETAVGDKPITLEKTDDAFAEEGKLYPENTWYYSYEPEQSTETSNGGYTTTVTNTLDPTKVTVTKTWDDEDNAWLTRPGTSSSNKNWSVKFALQRSSDGGTNWEWVLKYDANSPSGSALNDYDAGNVIKVTLKGDGSPETYTWSNLPKHPASGTGEYVYRVVEIMPKGYKIGSDHSAADYQESKDADGNTVVWVVKGQGYIDNTASLGNTQQYTNELRTVSLTGTKAWDGHGIDRLIPTDVNDAPTMTLYRKTESGAAQRVTKIVDDKAVVPQPTWTIGADGTWTYTYTGLPATDQSGKVYTYWAEEDAGTVDGFYPTYEPGETDAAGTTIVNDEKQTGTTITNVATKFKLDKRSDWPKTGEKESLNSIELTIKGTGGNANKTYAVWTRDVNGDETAKVWVNGTDNPNTGGIETSSNGVGWIIGLAAGNYVVTETGTVPEGYAKAPDVPITIGKDGKVSSSSGAVTAEGTNPGGTVTVTAFDPVFRAHFSIDKRLDDSSKTSLKGVKFELWQKGENGSDVQLTDAFTVNGTWSSKNNGSGVKRIDDGHGEKYTTLADGLLPGDYYLKEVETTDDALMPTGNDAIFGFTIVRDTTDDSKDHHGDVVPVTDNAENSASTQMLNTPFKADFKLTKVDATSGDGIKGATFKLEWRATGSTDTDPYTAVNNNLTTGDNGVLTFRVAKKGQYRLIEISNTGYDPDDFFQATFTLDDADYNQTFELNKALADDADNAIHFEVVAPKDGAFHTDGNVSNTRLFGKIQLEKSAPDVSDTKLNGAQFKLQKKDNGTWVDCNITDASGKAVTFVSGSTYTLNDDNTKVASTTTPNNGVVLIDHLQWGTYRFVETKAPDGYLTPTGDAANSGELVVDATHGIASASTVAKRNTPTNLNIRKMNLKGETLKVAGAKFTVTPAENYTFADGSENPITIQTRTDGIATLSKAKLVVGSHYLIEEIEAPQGYKIVKGQQEIVVNADGSVLLADTVITGYDIDTKETAGNNFTVTLSDEPVTLNLVKKDIASPSGASLDGATFKLQGLGADGDSSRSFTLTEEFADSDEYLVHNNDGSYTIEGLLIAGQSYELTETTAPDGYLPALDILRFTINANTGLPERTSAEGSRITLDGNTATVTALDETTSFSLKKVGVHEESGQLVETALSGAKFVVKPAEGSTFANAQGDENAKGITIKTDDKGIAGNELTGKLIVGKWYSLQETVPPAGHELNTSVVYFSPQKDGSYVFSTTADGTTAGLPNGYGYRAATADEATTAGLELVAQDTELIVGLQKTDLNNMPVPGATFTIEALDGSAFADGATKKTFTANGDKAFVSLEKELVAGDSYAITEVTAPAGYETIDTGDEGFKFTVGNDGTITAVSETAANDEPGFVVNNKNGVSIQAKDRPIEVQLKKVSTEKDADGNDAPLTGATFDLYEGEGTDGKMLGTIVTGADGIAYNADGNGDPTTTQAFTVESVTQLTAGKTYTLVETKAPDGYELVADALTFTVGEDGKLTATSDVDGYTIDSNNAATVVITAADQLIEVTLQKKGSDSGDELLPGASYELYQGEKAEGIRVWTGTTTADGVLEMTGLIGGQTYTLHEASAPAGYELMADVTFTVGADGTVAFKNADGDETEHADYEVSGDGVITITATDTAIDLTLNKKDLGGNDLTGATFKISGVFVDNQTRAVDSSSRDIVFTMTGASIDLTALEDGGATYSVVAGQDYTLTETKAPEGYEKLGSFTFTVNTDGIIKTTDTQAESGKAGYVIEDGSIAITAHDAPIEIGLIKRGSDQDAGDDPLKGAVFSVAPAEGSHFAGGSTDAIVGLTSDSITTELSGKLVAGQSYVLSETTAPAGYELLDDLTFKVNDDGSIELTATAGYQKAGENGIEVITATDEPIKITLKKTDLAGGQLNDATFKLTGKFTNDADGSKTLNLANGSIEVDGLIAGEEYTLAETAAPAGYEKIDGEFKFKVDARGKLTVSDGYGEAAEGAEGYDIEDDGVTITAADTKIEVLLAKKGSDSGDTLLSGAVFSLIEVDDEGQETTLNDKVTTSGAALELAGLVAGGNYILRETTAPAGYELLGDLSFSVDANGEVNITEAAGWEMASDNGVVTITATDPAIVVNIVKKGSDSDDEPLSGAKFTLEGTFSDTAETSKDVEPGTPVTGLIAGNKYTLTETTAPAGYELSGSTTFTVNTDGTITIDASENGAPVAGTDGSGTFVAEADTVTVTDEPVSIELAKERSDGKTLSGAEFELTGIFANADGTPAAEAETRTVPVDGTASVSGLIASVEDGAAYEYTLTETKAPAGYELNTTEFKFTVNEDGTIKAADQTGYSVSVDGITITATDEPVEITLNKAGSDNPDFKLNATFELTGIFANLNDGTANLEAEPATIEVPVVDGTATIDGLIAGKSYTLSEKDAPTGYELIDGSFTFTVNDDGTITAVTGEGIENSGAIQVNSDGITITATDTPIEITLSKQAAGSNEPLPGAEFTLSGKFLTDEGKVADESADKTITLDSKDATALIDDLVVGEEYTLTETKAPAGYEKLGTFTFKVNEQGEIVSQGGDGYTVEGNNLTVVANDTPIEARVEKLDEKGHKLPNAEFTITRTDDQSDTRTVTTGEDGTAVIDSAWLQACKTYTIDEVTAPEGFELAGSITFKVNEDGTLVIVDANGNESAAAECADGSGAYEVYADGGTAVIAATDGLIAAQLQKNSEDGSPLAGATFELTDKADPASAQALTVNEQGMTALPGLVAGHTYTLEETVAPAGHELNTTVFEFTVNADGTITAALDQAGYSFDGTDVITVTATDAPIEVTLNKADLAENALNGAIFSLSGTFANENGTPGSSATRELKLEDNTITIDGLIASREGVEYVYTLTEATAPEGYELLGEFQFTVDEHGAIHAVSAERAEGAAGYNVSGDGLTMTAHDQDIQINLSKQDAEGNALDGAAFELVPAEGSHFADGSTDAVSATPDTPVTGLVAGQTYVLTETAAPAGYEAISGSFTFTVNDDGTIAAASAENDPAFAVADDGITIVATDAAIEVGLIKLSADGTQLEGASFSLADADDPDTELATIASTAEGTVAIPGLVAGKTYVLTETGAPAGYELAEGSFTFTVGDDGTISVPDGVENGAAYSHANHDVVTVTVTDEPVEVQIEKLGENSASLTGATFTLAPAEGSTFADGSTEALTLSTTDGLTSVVSAQLVSGQTYVLTETAAPAGYELIAGSFTFTVAEDGTLAPAAEGNTSAYALGEDAGVITITATDEPASIELSKTDLSGNALEGAEFTLTGIFANADGTPAAEAETRTVPVDGTTSVSGLIASVEGGAAYEYQLVETVAPAGFELIDGTLTFTVDAQGNLVVDPGTVPAGYQAASGMVTVTAQDTPVEIVVAKQSESGEVLEGAEFTLSGTFADGAAEKDVTPGTPVTGLIAGEKYVLTETVAPAGYEKLGSIELTVAADGTVSGTGAGYEVAADGVTVVATDIAIEARVAKVDENGKPLAGATFAVAAADDPADTRTVTTGEDGTAALDAAWLVAGRTYTITEVEAPAGFELAGSASFTVAEDGTVSLVADDGSVVATVLGKDGSGSYEATVDGRTAVITAADTSIAAQLVKVAGSAPLAGAEFELAPAESSAFADGSAEARTLEVNANGLTALSGLVAGGTYVLRETVAPAGYELIAGELTFTVGEDGTLTAAEGAPEAYAIAERGGVITIVADDSPVEVTLTKTDLSGNALTGAEFTLRGEFANADGTPAGTVEDRTVTVDENGSATLTGLVAGATYTLTESVAPAGHELAGSFSFTVAPDGTVSVAEGSAQAAEGAAGYRVGADGVTLVAADAPVEARLIKTSTDGTPLAGAEFTLAPAEGSAFADGGNDSRKVVVCQYH